MSAGARRGASPAVAAILNGSTANLARASESAFCPHCKGVLRFKVDNIGRTLERCETPRCVNVTWHHPQPDPNAAEPKGRKDKRKTPGIDSRQFNTGRRGTVPPELRGGNV